MRSFELVRHVINADIEGSATMKLLLVVIADGTNEATGLHFTSMTRLARLLGIDERSARRVVSKAKQLHYLHVVDHEAGGDKRKVPSYRINLGALPSAKVIHTGDAGVRGCGSGAVPHQGPIPGHQRPRSPDTDVRHTSVLPSIPARPVDNIPRSGPAAAPNTADQKKAASGEATHISKALTYDTSMSYDDKQRVTRARAGGAGAAAAVLDDALPAAGARE